MNIRKNKARELIFHIQEQQRKKLRPSFLELGLTLGQGQPRILNTLLTRDSIPQKELAGNCYMDVTTLSRTLDHLQEAGLIVRLPHPSCRRSYLIELTSEGREKARAVRKYFDEMDQVIGEGFSPQEMEALCIGLEKISRNLDS